MWIISLASFSMKKLTTAIATTLFLCACQQQTSTPADASQAEINMATMMGITVEELRNQTPEEHMQMMQQMMHDQATDNVQGFLPGTGVDVNTLPEVEPTETITVADGDTIELTPTLVQKTLNGKTFAMYGYNNQIPGPMIKTTQDAEFTVVVRNQIDMETTVHWHGLRLDNASDGVPGLTQPEAILPGESFTYTVSVPDEGIYWYHPHVREDIQQDMGLYGNIFVEPPDASLYSPVHAEEVLVLDDLLLDNQGAPVAYGTNGALQSGKDDVNYSLMGRFGTVPLVNGEPEYSLSFSKGSVVRFLVTNVANTRTFRIGVPGARMKRVGSDIGRYEREEWADFVTLAPAERAIVEVLFAESGEYALVHSSPVREMTLASITVTEDSVSPDYAAGFEDLRSYPDVSDDIRQYAEEFARPVDKELRLTIAMNGRMAGMNHGMMTHTEDGIEWEDGMPHMNETMRNDELDWNLVDHATGKMNMDIDWQFTKGDVVKVRIVNDAASAHPMQHPIHFHGQRFLVLSMDGEPTENFVWKDTVLIPTGSTAEILIEMSNPGEWMFHCHIAEHLSNGMMGKFTVLP